MHFVMVAASVRYRIGRYSEYLISTFWCRTSTITWVVRQHNPQGWKPRPDFSVQHVLRGAGTTTTTTTTTTTKQQQQRQQKWLRYMSSRSFHRRVARRFTLSPSSAKSSSDGGVLSYHPSVIYYQPIAGGDSANIDVLVPYEY